MIVVYTTIFGRSDSVKPAPAGADRCVCITDDKDLAGGGWEFLYHEIPPGSYARKEARIMQSRSDLLFGVESRVVWVDASCELKDLARLLRDSRASEFAALKHPDRSDLLSEGKQTIALGQSPNGLVEQQLVRYSAEGFASQTVSTTCLFVRRHTGAVCDMNRIWEEQLIKYGMNDQISVDYSAWKARVRIDYLEGSYMTYHKHDHHKRRRPGWAP